MRQGVKQKIQPINTPLPKITHNQERIIKLLYKFRFINTYQFQRLFNHKDPSTVQELLKDLKLKKYIGSDYRRDDFSRNTQPAKYFLAPLGRKFLKGKSGFDINFLERVYKEKERKDVFKNQCIERFNMYLFLLSQQKKDEELKFFTEANLTKYQYFPDTEFDAYIVMQEKNRIRRFFLHIFKDSDPKWLPRQKIKGYIKYFDENTWQENTNYSPFPALLFVLPTLKLRTHIFKYGKAVLDNEVTSEIDLFLTTKQIIQLGNKNIWQKVE